jgi:penicillin amidase
MKWLSRAGIALVALALLALAAGSTYGWLSLPQTQGELRLAGLTADTRIERDAHGVPTVRAVSLHDALFGLGVAHAQDRLWEMETHRRIAAGRLRSGRPCPPHPARCCRPVPMA